MSNQENRSESTKDFITTRRQLLASGAAAATVGSISSRTASAASTDTITIIHDTHFHGRFEGRDGRSIAEYTSAIREQLAAHDNAVFFGNGDDLSPSLMGLVFKGRHMIDALNYIHDDVDGNFVDGAGNHDFDFGVDNASARFSESSFPWVVANLLTPNGNPIPGTQRWTTVDVGPVTVGVFGLGVEDFHGITAYPDEYQVIDPVEAAKTATKALKTQENADIVVLASHTNHSTHKEIAQAVDELDLIVGSHSGVTFEHVHDHSGTLVSEMGDQFKYLGAVTLKKSTGELVEWQKIDVTSRVYQANSGMQAIVDEWQSKLNDEFNTTVVRSAVELDTRFNTNYGRESRYGNLITDIFRAELDADIGIQNPGGIRSNKTYGPGAISKKDIYNTLPFPNTLVKLELSGKTLVETLTSSIRALPWSSYGIQPAMQISGVQYEYSGHNGDPQVENVFVNNEALNPEATYTVATNNYVAENWDSLSSATLVQETSQLLADVVVDHLAPKERISPEIENRILRVDSEVGGSEARRRGTDSDISVIIGKPEQAISVSSQPAAYHGITKTGTEIPATDVQVLDDAVKVFFDPATFPDAYERAHLRVFGEFEPDDKAYGYHRDDGTLYDLPVSVVYDTYRLKAPVGEVQRNKTP